MFFDDEWESYNPFDEEDDSTPEPWEYRQDWPGDDPFTEWWEVGEAHAHAAWLPVAEVICSLGVNPSDQLIEQLQCLPIADIQRASGLKAAGVLPENIIKEMRLLLPGTATQQLCQLAGIVDYEDSRRD